MIETPTDVRYIKLGKGGKYKKECLRGGIMRIGFGELPFFADKVGMTDGNLRAEICKADSLRGNMVADFYLLGEKTLWFTFADGRMWWCFAMREVRELDKDNRVRTAMSGWSDTTCQGTPLDMEKLDGRLTKTALYRATICSPGWTGALQYLERVINDKHSENADNAQKHRAAAVQSIANLIQTLNDKDFEVLVDLVFSRNGWRRMARVGGTREAVDIILELPDMEGGKAKTACVQVKSESTVSVFEKCRKSLLKRSESRKFFVFHTGEAPDSCDDITVIGRDELAEMVFKAGLFDWLVNRPGL